MRRTRIDLGQEPSAKEEVILDRKRRRWADRNKNRDPNENPFLKAIRPDQEHYGDPDEKKDEMKVRLSNLEFGNFPGYFNYRKKASSESKNCSSKNDNSQETTKSITNLDGQNEIQRNQEDPTTTQTLEAGLSDERLEYLEKKWFSGKNVLDIGCNRGHITYAIARLFSPKSIVGIDIDLKMINMANRDLHLHLEEGMLKEARELRRERAVKFRLEGGSTNYLEDVIQFPLSSYISHGPLVVSAKQDEREEATEDNSAGAEYYRFPNNIVFVEHNYVLAKDELVEKQKAYFDTIVCLSVTKWIHLNYRDDGLKRFFGRIYNHLKPGGLLILEAQPFDNYGRRKRLSDRLRINYYSIQFKPDEFDTYLLSDQVGFRQIIHETTTKHECLGFKRPLKVFLK